jgi:5-methyltetrahydropteroyltriglutamate--homocysteine methyltransferase
VAKLGADRVIIAPSCSLLHSPIDLDLETAIDPEIKNWMAFAKQKLSEVSEIKQIAEGNNICWRPTKQPLKGRRTSQKVHKQAVKDRVKAITEADATRHQSLSRYVSKYTRTFNLPSFPTTTIGSFPQTDDIRQLRAKFKKGDLTLERNMKSHRTSNY